MKWMKTYRIKQIAKMTGLSKEVLRMWEKRYRLVSPQRGPNRYRLYTEEDLKILMYLVNEIEAGQSIGELASLGKDEILVRINNQGTNDAKETVQTTDFLIKDLEKSLIPLDQPVFEKRLREIMAILPFQEVFERILVPLQIRVGELWFDGKISIAVEHYVTNQVKQKLFSILNMMGSQDGPKVVITCPPWELHEIGAQMVAYHCSTIGCQVTLLGANLPMESLIEYCTRSNPDAVLISFTSPVSENNGRIFFAELTKSIAPLCSVLVGGQGIAQQDKIKENKNIKFIKSLSDLEIFLNT
jgi:DNA-binding transcriptional MerR regulator/methylmalonyl-CoA mutase cobalamin-binding subunit